MSTQVEVQVASSSVPPLLREWLSESLPLDIRVSRREVGGWGHLEGRRTLVFTVYGSDSSDVTAKTLALGRLLSRMSETSLQP